MTHDDPMDEAMFELLTGRKASGLAMAPYFAWPRGSMGEDIEPLRIEVWRQMNDAMLGPEVQLCRYGRNTTSLRTQPCNCAPGTCRLGRTP
jgi:hypothetical protein